MTPQEYLKKFPIIETFDELAKTETLVSLMTLDRLVENTEEAYKAIIAPQLQENPRQILPFEYYQRFADHFQIFRENSDFRTALETLNVLWTFIRTDEGKKRIRENPRLDPDQDLTSLAARALISYVANPASLSGLTLKTINRVLDKGFDANMLIHGELPPEAVGGFSWLTADERLVSLADSLLGLACIGTANGYGSLSFDHETAGKMHDLFFLCGFKPKVNLARQFYDLYATKLQTKGFNHRISVAAARLGLMLEATDSEMADIAMYLVRTYPAFETLITVLAAIPQSEVQRAGAPIESAPVLCDASIYLIAVRERQKADNPAATVEDAIAEALPIFQHLIMNARLRLTKNDLDRLHYVNFHEVRIQAARRPVFLAPQ